MRPRCDDRWRELCAGKLTAAAEAVRIVKSGQHVYAGGWTSVPMTLCRALADRRGEIRGVTVSTYLTPFSWDDPAILESFRIRTFYTGPFERPAVQAGRFEYVPIAQWRMGCLPPGFGERLDVAMIPISPPDARGFCSYGTGAWFSPTVSRHAEVLMAK